MPARPTRWVARLPVREKPLNSNPIIRAIERYATLHPDREAIRGTKQVLSWTRLQAETMAAATALADGGVLGLHVANSPSWIVVDLAATLWGTTVVPLPGFFTDAQLRHAIEDAGIDTVITDQPWRISALARISGESKMSVAGRSFTRLRTSSASERAGRTGTAKITYTSGTTGEPRGVCLRAGAILRVAKSLTRASGAGPADRAIVVLPLSVLLENIGSVLAPLLTGATIIVPDPDDVGVEGSSGVNPERFARALDRYRPTTIILPPQLLKLLVGIARRGHFRHSFRFIAVGSAPVGESLLLAAQDLALPVFQGYGLTEACSVVAVNTPTANRIGSVGKPLLHTRVRVDEAGRIFVSGTTCEGYLGRSPLAPGTEVDTGDVGELDDDGFLYVRGRSRSRIVTGYGRNVCPEWVEAELASSEWVARATVISESDDLLAAVLVPANGASAARLSRAVRDANARLPDYARIGRFVVARPPFGSASMDPSCLAMSSATHATGSEPGSG